MDTSVGKALSRAKIGMLQKPNTVFLSTVCFSLETEITTSIETAATNGKKIMINPEFFMRLSHEERIFLLAHETLHVAYMHMIRLEGREPAKWNMACDYVINDHLLSHGYHMPTGGLYNRAFKDMTSDAVYPLLQNTAVPANFMHDLISQDSDEHGEEIETIVLRASMHAQLAGQGGVGIPPEIQRMLEDLLKPKVDWKKTLAHLLLSKSKADYSYTRFNRKYLEEDIYLPTLNEGGKLTHIDFAVDVSGSVTSKVCTQFCSEMHSVLQQFSPEKIDVYQFGTDVVKTTSVYGTQDLLKLKFVGGGGTRISPVLNAFKHSKAKALVILTDGHIWSHDYYQKPDNRPIIWCIYDNPEFQCSFGKIVHVKFKT